MRSRFPLDHGDTDARVVEAQLGRPVRGRWAVARRCHLGVPMVIENHPRLEDGSPFPTLFWLTCPILKARVSRLEGAGWMAELGEEIAHDPKLRARFVRALDAYRARRNEHEPIEGCGGPPGGGPDRVKCLHAHVAHELAAPPNPIGARALARTGWPDCLARCVEEDE
jgi:uncharacterized protein